MKQTFKTPLVWAGAVMYLYAFVALILTLVFSPFANWMNAFIFALLIVLVLFAVLVALIFVWLPPHITRMVIKALPFGLILFNLFLTLLGGIYVKFLFGTFLPLLPNLRNSPAHASLLSYMLFTNINGAVMFPVGFVALYFSVLQLLKNKLLK